MRDDHRGAQERDQPDAAPPQHDGRDDQRQPQPQRVLERERREVAPARAPPRVPADLGVPGVRQPVVIVGEPEREVRRHDQRERQPLAHQPRQIEPAMRRAPRGDRERDCARDQQAIGPREAGEREPQRRERRGACPAAERLLLVERAQHAGDHQQLEEARLEPARRPHREAARARERERRDQHQPLAATSRAPPAERDDQEPKTDRAGAAQRVGDRLGRQAEPIEPGEDQHPEEVAVALDRGLAGVEHEAGAVAQVAGVTERDERVVGEERVGAGVEGEHNHCDQQPEHRRDHGRRGCGRGRGRGCRCSRGALRVARGAAVAAPAAHLDPRARARG